MSELKEKYNNEQKKRAREIKSRYKKLSRQMRFGKTYHFMNGAEAYTGFVGKMENPQKIEFVHRYIQSLYENFNMLDEELKTLKEKTESEKIEELKDIIKEKDEEISRLSNVVACGFSEEELQKIDEWFKEHIAKYPIDWKIKKCSDHDYTLIIAPTHLGTFRYAKCSCGEIFDLGEA